ncbi:unnamed protein product [Didymodactylos carnosus]|uniref:ER membrane protein complex subunit 2 n=1 Tax=Didymodactylos carnosus TaxID=1234261 RepID=A0A813RPG2_9BILA|nr:unnamed protein product [Didymodactylos carnosus]CAF1422267.1 unnamed protein product [Didymodactylos carnosus]CAF3567282.1 unnamed protein product [Didymodactylos carnosus]CAF4222632.1 unnamed protein product [Didymodactylos carnosus]
MQAAVEKLRKYRDENYRCHDEVLEIWQKHLSQRNLSSLGDEKWLILEQVLKSALQCNQLDVADKCTEILAKQFKQTSRRISTLYAMSYEARDDYDRADKIYQSLSQDNETDSTVRKRQISILKAQNKIKDAINELNGYLQLYQTDVEAWSELCELYLIEHDYAKAAFCAEELLLINPHNHLNHERYASIRYSQGLYEVARSYYFSAYKINSSNIRTLYGILLTSMNLMNRNLNTTSTTSALNRDENLEYISWAKDKLIEKYKEQSNQELTSIVDISLQNLMTG